MTDNIKLLITGGAGCLGSNLVDRYLAQGSEICVIDNFATGHRETLPDSSGLTIVEGSVGDSDLVMETFLKFIPTHVVHCAAAYKDPDNWIEDTKTNVLGTINVVKASLRATVSRFINFQTALCYGRPSVVPIPLAHPLRPFTSYGISKTAGEQYLLNSGLPAVSLRLANVCGPRLSIGPIPTFYKRLKAGQNCFCSRATRDFLDMEDFFSLVDLLLETSDPVGAFNVSTGEGHTIQDVFESVAKHLGLVPPKVAVVPPGDDDVPVVVLDPTETEQAFGWKARIGFEETIRRQLDWYDSHGVDHIFSHLSSQKQ